MKKKSTAKSRRPQKKTTRRQPSPMPAIMMTVLIVVGLVGFSYYWWHIRSASLAPSHSSPDTQKTTSTSNTQETIDDLTPVKADPNALAQPGLINFFVVNQGWTAGGNVPINVSWTSSDYPQYENGPLFTFLHSLSTFDFSVTAHQGKIAYDDYDNVHQRILATFDNYGYQPVAERKCVITDNKPNDCLLITNGQETLALITTSNWPDADANENRFLDVSLSYVATNPELDAMETWENYALSSYVQMPTELTGAAQLTTIEENTNVNAPATKIDGRNRYLIKFNSHVAANPFVYYTVDEKTGEGELIYSNWDESADVCDDLVDNATLAEADKKYLQTVYCVGYTPDPNQKKVNREASASAGRQTSSNENQLQYFVN